MSNKYPSDKINELNKYMNNFNNDIKAMKLILEKINEWNNRGFNLTSSVNPLKNQIDEWEKTMTLLLDFNNNLINLKKLDDTIDTNIEIKNIKGSFIDKWNNFYNIYKNLFDNLNADITLLKKVKNDINKYQDLGVKLGDSINIINNQINDILDGINNSLINLDEIKEKIKEVSKKILIEEELNEKNDNILAMYTNISRDSNTFLVYMNMNKELRWDPDTDGKNILKYVTKALIDSKSESGLYNSDYGNNQYNTNTNTQFNYIYYGFDKNNMIEDQIDDTDYGISYQDQHGYQYTLTSFHKPL